MMRPSRDIIIKIVFSRSYLSNGRAIGMVVVVCSSLCMSVSNGCIVVNGQIVGENFLQD